MLVDDDDAGDDGAKTKEKKAGYLETIRSKRRPLVPCTYFTFHLRRFSPPFLSYSNPNKQKEKTENEPRYQPTDSLQKLTAKIGR